MTSALTGSTTERGHQEEDDQRRRARGSPAPSGRWARSDALLVEERRRLAADRSVERRGDGPHRAHEVLRLARSAAARARSGRCRPRRPAAARPAPAAAPRTRAPAPARRGDRDVDRRRLARRELGPQRVVDHPRRLVLRQHRRVDAGEADLQERQAERDQQHRRARRDRRPAGASPAASGGTRSRCARPAASRAIASFQRRGPPALTRSPSAPEQRRQQRQRHAGGDQRAQRAADAHRVQEALAEDDQRRQRGRDRDRAERDRRAPRCAASRASAASRSVPRASSSRKRLTMNSE